MGSCFLRHGCLLNLFRHHFINHEIDRTKTGKHAEDLKNCNTSSQVEPLYVYSKGKNNTQQVDQADDTIMNFNFGLQATVSHGSCVWLRDRKAIRNSAKF
jgi:hypothetical protein